MGVWCKYWLLIGTVFFVQPSRTLKCYECSESFTDIWVPLDCQVNATAVSARECTDEQPFCFVASMTVKGILTEITRNCIDQCFYGCVASEFGVTAITCTSCCDKDLCNTGNMATTADVNSLCVWSLTFFSVAVEILLYHHYLNFH